jgi:hypothetical protein
MTAFSVGVFSFGTKNDHQSFCKHNGDHEQQGQPLSSASLNMNASLGNRMVIEALGAKAVSAIQADVGDMIGEEIIHLDKDGTTVSDKMLEVIDKEETMHSYFTLISSLEMCFTYSISCDMGNSGKYCVLASSTKFRQDILNFKFQLVIWVQSGWTCCFSLAPNSAK